MERPNMTDAATKAIAQALEIVRLHQNGGPLASVYLVEALCLELAALRESIEGGPVPADWHERMARGEG